LYVGAQIFPGVRLLDGVRQPRAPARFLGGRGTRLARWPFVGSDQKCRSPLTRFQAGSHEHASAPAAKERAGARRDAPTQGSARWLPIWTSDNGPIDEVLIEFISTAKQGVFRERCWMIYRGKVHGGVIVLPPGVQLPEDSNVMVEPVRDPLRIQDSVHYMGSMRNGVPIFPIAASGPGPGLELVNRLRDELP